MGVCVGVGMGRGWDEDERRAAIAAHECALLVLVLNFQSSSKVPVLALLLY